MVHVSVWKIGGYWRSGLRGMKSSNPHPFQTPERVGALVSVFCGGVHKMMCFAYHAARKKSQRKRWRTRPKRKKPYTEQGFLAIHITAPQQKEARSFVRVPFHAYVLIESHLQVPAFQPSLEPDTCRLPGLCF